jgi:hypothetical protein
MCDWAIKAGQGVVVSDAQDASRISQQNKQMLQTNKQTPWPLVRYTDRATTDCRRS